MLLTVGAMREPCGSLERSRWHLLKKLCHWIAATAGTKRFSGHRVHRIGGGDEIPLSLKDSLVWDEEGLDVL